MASIQLPDFDYSAGYFTFTKVCSTCRRQIKTFKVLLAGYDSRVQCKLTREEKEEIGFVCLVCGIRNFLDFEQI